MSPSPFAVTSPTDPASYSWEATDEGVAARFGIPVSQVLRFDLNTSPAPPEMLPGLLAANRFETTLSEYPPGDYRRLITDHICIYLLIAGTYTPVCLISMRGPWGWSMLAGAWGIALAGSAARIAWRRKPEWLTFCLYLLMGWGSLIALSPLSATWYPTSSTQARLMVAWYFCGAPA